MADEPVNELDQLKRERDEYLNGWKRAKADFINYQKDEAKRFEELVKFANAGLMQELISVLDSFTLADKHDDPIKTQLETILKKNGLEKIAVKLGQSFDANFQESVAEAESDQPAGTIIEEAASGYLLNGRVIRPAKVKLSKGKQNA